MSLWTDEAHVGAARAGVAHALGRTSE
jgi:hypothetical protein